MIENIKRFKKRLEKNQEIWREEPSIKFYIEDLRGHHHPVKNDNQIDYVFEYLFPLDPPLYFGLSITEPCSEIADGFLYILRRYPIQEFERFNEIEDQILDDIMKEILLMKLREI